MKLKFKRFIKRFLIVTVISAFLFCFLTISSFAYSASGSEANSFENSDLIFFNVPELRYWPSDDPSVETVVGGSEVSSVRYRLTSDKKLVLDVFYMDPIFSYGNTYEILLKFQPSDNLKTPSQIPYGSYKFHLPSSGNGFNPISDFVSSYRTGVDSSTNTAVVDFAWVDNTFPTFTSTFSAASSNKVIYDYYYLKFRFTFGNSSTPSRNSIFFYLYDTNFESMSFSQYDTLYGWDSPVNTPSSGALDDMTSLEDSIIGGTNQGRQNTIDLFSNFSLVPWLRKGFLATTHIFNLFADIPALNEILKFSLIFGSFAFVVGMSISLVKKR